MANTIKGKILSIGEVREIPTRSGRAYQKRELVLDASRFDVYTGERRENFPTLTFTGNRVAILEDFAVGEMAEVSFFLQGRAYAKDGQTLYINDVIGYKIERVAQPQSAPVESAQYEGSEQAQPDGFPFPF